MITDLKSRFAFKIKRLKIYLTFLTQLSIPFGFLFKLKLDHSWGNSRESTKYYPE